MTADMRLSAAAIELVAAPDCVDGSYVSEICRAGIISRAVESHTAVSERSLKLQRIDGVHAGGLEGRKQSKAHPNRCAESDRDHDHHGIERDGHVELESDDLRGRQAQNNPDGATK